LLDILIQIVLKVKTFPAQTFLNGKNEIVLKSRLFVLDFITVFFPEGSISKPGYD